MLVLSYTELAMIYLRILLTLFLFSTASLQAQEFSNPDTLLLEEALPAPIELGEDERAYLSERGIGGAFFLSEIPEQYASSFELSSPEVDVVSMSNSIMVKGRNDFGTATFVNGEQVRLRGDGSFFYELKLSSDGKQFVFVTFTTPDLKFFTVKRRVLRLMTPSDIDAFNTDRKTLVYFYNTPFITGMTREKKLGSLLTRAELAYFVTVLKTQKPKGDLAFSDVPESHWAASAIAYSVTEGYMSEFPDGTFQPDYAVTQLEYIMTLVRALDLPFDESRAPLPFDGIKGHAWQGKFVRTALVNNLILSSDSLTLSKPLTLAAFMLWADRVPEVKEVLANLVELSEDEEITDTVQDDLLLAVYTSLKAEEERRESLRKIVFTQPLPQSTTTTDTVVFTGQIYPPQEFLINEFVIVPDVDGNFVSTVSVGLGKNTYEAMALGERSTFTVVRLDSYLDLEGHWLETTAAELKYLDLLEQTEDFFPNKEITRGELALYLDGFFTVTANEQSTVDPFDIDPSDATYEAAKAMVERAVLSLDGSGFFYPDKVVSRAEGLTAIVRALDPFISETVTPVAFPYFDIPLTHWSREFVEMGVSLGLVTPSKTFAPTDALTKAAFIAMIAKTPPILVQREKLFLND